MASLLIKTHEGQVPKTLEEVWDRSPKKLIVYGMHDTYYYLYYILFMRPDPPIFGC